MMAYIKPKLVTELRCAVMLCVTVVCERNVRLTSTTGMNHPKNTSSVRMLCQQNKKFVLILW
jgi:hypothetical protein